MNGCCGQNHLLKGTVLSKWASQNKVTSSVMHMAAVCDVSSDTGPAVACNSARSLSEPGSYLLILYIISILNISWALFLVKNRVLKKVPVPAAALGVLHPLVPSLRKISGGRAPGRERLNDTLNRSRGQANAHWAADNQMALPLKPFVVKCG